MNREFICVNTIIKTGLMSLGQAYDKFQRDHPCCVNTQPVRRVQVESWVYKIRHKPLLSWRGDENKPINKRTLAERNLGWDLWWSRNSSDPMSSISKKKMLTTGIQPLPDVSPLIWSLHSDVDLMMWLCLAVWRFRMSAWEDIELSIEGQPTFENPSLVAFKHRERVEERPF